MVTWRDKLNPDTVYRRFQVFDAADEPILSWRSRGHLLDYGKWGKYAEPYWLDDDRFVAFWTYGGLVGGVFGHRGLTRYPIRTVVVDEKAIKWYATVERSFFVAFSSDERFAETHGRSYHHLDPWCVWDHGGGVLGEIRDNEPWRRTNLFEYTPPLGKDTTWGDFLVFTNTVAACDDRIVWVYSRPNLDTIYEAWALITDWDMGVGVVESPIQTASPILVSASLNRLSYDVSGSVTGEAKLTLYSSDGRRVLTKTIQGKGTWTPSPPSSLPSGVYFARVEGETASARAKVVILR
ncbi:MAG: T9SS type A sorting domain-containing protein [Candidatus Stahlbacteria bacterium]|nr:MAG: T9SS type A sorting domain-containing protein [Candidatus Stahlbacteria bacterium]